MARLLLEKIGLNGEGVIEACGTVENTGLLFCTVLMLHSMTSGLKRNIVSMQVRGGGETPWTTG